MVSRLFNNSPDPQPMTDWQRERATPDQWDEEFAAVLRRQQRVQVAIVMAIVFILTVWAVSK